MNDNALSALVAVVSNALLALLGVDYYAVVWAFVGSLLALQQTKGMGRTRAVLYVLLSTLIGAALGTGAVAFFGSTHRAFTVICSLVGGLGSQVLLAQLLQAAISKIKLLGGGNESA